MKTVLWLINRPFAASGLFVNAVFTVLCTLDAVRNTQYACRPYTPASHLFAAIIFLANVAAILEAAKQ